MKIINEFIHSKHFNYSLIFIAIASLFPILYYLYLLYNLQNYTILIFNNENHSMIEIKVTYDYKDYKYDTSKFNKITFVHQLVERQRVIFEIKNKNKTILKEGIYVSETPSKFYIELNDKVFSKREYLSLFELIFYSNIKDSVLINE